MNWYVGTCQDAAYTLFTRHRVDEVHGHYISKPAGSAADASEAAKFLIEMFKTQGCSGGSDENANIVYAYVITDTTRE